MERKIHRLSRNQELIGKVAGIVILFAIAYKIVEFIISVLRGLIGL